MAFFDNVRQRAQPARSGDFTLSIFGDTQISRGFVTGAGRMRDMRPAWHEIHDWLLETNLRHFRAEGPGWKALKKSTERERARLGIGASHPILDRTGASYDGHKGGDLKRSLTVKGDPNTKVTLTRRQFRFESLVAYGEHLQKSERKPFQLSESERRMPMRIIHRRVMGAS